MDTTTDTHRIRCANCDGAHTSVAAIAACHLGALTTCGWLVEHPGRWVDAEWTNHDGTTEATSDYIEGGLADCGAETIHTARGWTCAHGHEHVNIDTRLAEGWDHAEDYDEALGMARAGVEPRTMSGHTVLGPRSFDRAA